MGVISSPALVVLVVLVLATSVCADVYDGKPRPPGFDDAPSTTLGAKPAVKYKGKPADCVWYAWENYNYSPADTKNCSTLLWEPLSADASGLSGFTYYSPLDDFYDPKADEYLCVIGCFKLEATASAPSATPPATPPAASSPPPAASSPPPAASSPPPAASSPPPAASSPPPATSSPPPATSAPPPVISSPPPKATPPVATPPVMAPPPPATLFRPPPPGTALPPPSVVTSPPSGGPTEAPVPATSGGSVVFPVLSFGVAMVLAAAVLGFAL